MDFYPFAGQEPVRIRPDLQAERPHTRIHQLAAEDRLKLEEGAKGKRPDEARESALMFLLQGAFTPPSQWPR